MTCILFFFFFFYRSSEYISLPSDHSSPAEKLPQGHLRIDARVLAQERRGQAQLPGDPHVPPEEKSRLQARGHERHLIQRARRLEPDPAFYDRRAERELVELPFHDQVTPGQTKLVVHRGSIVKVNGDRNRVARPIILVNF